MVVIGPVDLGEDIPNNVIMRLGTKNNSGVRKYELNRQIPLIFYMQNKILVGFGLYAKFWMRARML